MCENQTNQILTLLPLDKKKDFVKIRLSMQQALKDSTNLISAAVLIPLHITKEGLSLLFTKRSQTVRHHKGQICFPGGAKENHDFNLWHTALRETEEEIGLKQNHIHFISQLSNLTTPTGFHITPYVGFISELDQLKPNPEEICEIFSAPIAHFLDQKNVRFEEREYFGKKINTPFYDYKTHIIWGATGRMILSLIQMSAQEKFQLAIRSYL